MVEQDGVRLQVDTSQLEESIRVAPRAVYYWLRTWLFRAVLNHRVQWLRSKRTSFGRGKNAIRVWRVNEAPAGAVDPKWIVYRVAPNAQRFESAAAAARGIGQLRAEVFAGSVALEVHEFGRTINVSPKWLAIPVRKGPRSPKAWRAANPGKTLITIPDPNDSSKLFLAEPKRYRGRRAAGVEARNRNKKVVRTKLVWRFVLVHQVHNMATLGFYGAWDALSSARQTDFVGVSNRILQDVARGKLA